MATLSRGTTTWTSECTEKIFQRHVTIIYRHNKPNVHFDFFFRILEPLLSLVDIDG